MIKTRTLDQMHNRATAYEIELCIRGVVTHLGFSERKTREVLFKFARANGDAIMAALTEDEANAAWKYRNGSLDFAQFVSVRFSGRTERDICSANMK